MTVLDPIIALLTGYTGRVINLSQVITAVDRPRRCVLRVLDRLAREGYLAEIRDEPIPPGPGECGPPRRNPTWRIVAAKLPALPDLQKPATHKRTARDRIWSYIRARRRWTVADLMRTCQCPRKGAAHYVRILEREGYIRATGKDEKWKVWMIARELPVKRPRLQEKVTREVRS